MTSDVAVRTENLTKFYGDQRGIEGLNLEVDAGEVMGFLGPNGAGKTTTIRLLLDFLRPTRGRAAILGLDPRRDKATLHRQHWTVVNMAVRDAAQRFQFENPFARPVGHQSNGLPTIQQYDAYFLSVKEAEILVAACPPRVRDLVIVALGTGMRIGELLGLRVGAISLSGEHPVIHVVKSLRQTGGLSAPKSRRGRRSIDLPPTVVEVLRRLIAGKSHKDFVFASPNGKPWNANNFRNRSWRYVVAAAQRCSVHPPEPKKVGNGSAVDQVKSLAVSTCGCATRLHQRPRFHDLRHSYVAYLIAAGFDFLAIQRLIGHASIKTTFDTYGHRLPHGDKERLAQLNKLLPGGAKAADLEEFERKRSKSSKKKTKKDMAPFIAGMKPVA